MIGNYQGDYFATSHLENDHPISLNYITARGDKPGTLQTRDYARTRGIVFFPPNGSADRVECSSCHDVHSTTYSSFLVMDNDSHDKTPEILEDIFPIKRQIKGGNKPGIPDIVGIDKDGSICMPVSFSS